MALSTTNIRCFGLFVGLLVATTLQAAPPAQLSLTATFDMWSRAPGNYNHKSKQVPRHKARTITITAKQLKPRKLWDHQYKTSATYMVLPLHKLLQRYPRTADTDMALLHFHNRMQIPYPLRLLTSPKRPKVFIAFARWSPQHRAWTRSFPALRKTNTKLYKDVRPLRFRGNKLVMKQSWHPLHPMPLHPVAKKFRPWQYADSLQGIEFVNQASYDRQFAIAAPGQPNELKGQQLFRQICQFCHGVRLVGARYGWDFVDPYPLYRHRRGMSLLWHLRYRSTVAVEQGAMMPAIRGMTRRDAFAIWYWLRAAAKRPLHPYRTKSIQPKVKPPTSRK